MNSDGYFDVAVGTGEAEVNELAAAGVVRVFGGSAGGVQPVPVISVDGVVSLTKLGASLVGGAVNGDGFSGVLIGAPEADLARTDAGAVRLVFGASSQPGDPQAIVLRFDPDGAWRFGAAVSGADDSNGDGISDFVVGAADPSLLMPFRSGAAHILQGNATRIALMPARVFLPEAA